MLKFLFDYFPIICFFVAYKIWGIFTATAVTIGASTLQNIVYWIKHRRFERLHIITFALIVILGSITLIFHKPIFIQWKPTIVYWVFFITLMGSHYIGDKTIMHRLLGDKIEVPAVVWRRINMGWALFFLVMGFLNLYVVYHYNMNAWVNFKLFGTIGLTFIFMIIQVIYMARYINPDKLKQNKHEKSKQTPDDNDKPKN